MSKTKRHIEKRNLNMANVQKNISLDDEYYYNEYLEKINVEKELAKISEREWMERINHTKNQ